MMMSVICMGKMSIQEIAEHFWEDCKQIKGKFVKKSRPEINQLPPFTR